MLTSTPSEIFDTIGMLSIEQWQSILLYKSTKYLGRFYKKGSNFFIRPPKSRNFAKTNALGRKYHWISR